MEDRVEGTELIPSAAPGPLNVPNSESLCKDLCLFVAKYPQSLSSPLLSLLVCQHHLQTGSWNTIFALYSLIMERSILLKQHVIRRAGPFVLFNSKWDHLLFLVINCHRERWRRVKSLMEHTIWVEEL